MQLCSHRLNSARITAADGSLLRLLLVVEEDASMQNEIEKAWKQRDAALAQVTASPPPSTVRRPHSQAAASHSHAPGGGDAESPAEEVW